MTTEHATTKDESVSPVKRALLAVKTLQAKIDALEQAKTEPIAIIGMGCRFPHNADTPEKFWQLLESGETTLQEVPASRWDVDAYYHPDQESLPPGKTYTRKAHFLSQVDQFDAQFFGISGREAAKMDPQQRLLLEVGWEAFERAGQTGDRLMGSNTGVFLGISTQDYYHFVSSPIERNDMYTMSGNNVSVAAGRLAYVWGLTGPTFAVDTACSSSLVAVHLACQSLRAGECDAALAGGVALMLTPHFTIQMAQSGALSPDSLCKTFSADANGYSQGEGCGLVVLKRLSDALRDDDNIIAVIRGSAINHDGRSSGLTVPNAIAQQNVIQQALANSGIEPVQVGYIEAHGTGTLLGDPIEVEALGEVFKERTDPLYIGSAKTNIGHLDSAAGIVGLMKAALALQHKRIPPHLHCNELNPRIAWETLPIEVATSTQPFPAHEGKQFAGVSAFGVSGTNGHVILQEAPCPPSIPPEIRGEAMNESERPWHLLNLSAKSADALQALAQQYQDFLRQQSDLALGNISYTANIARSHFEHRLSLSSPSIEQMVAKLATFCQGESGVDIRQGYVPEYQKKQRIAFLFTGQGSQYRGMGHQLYETQPTFRATINRCAEVVDAYLEKSLLSVIFGEEVQRDGSDLLSQTMYTQPALFTLEYALAMIWQSWGIEPNVVIGHSVGEYVAACVAGVFSLEDALKLIAARGRLMQALPRDGAMLSVMANQSGIEQVIAPVSREVSIAAINGPQSVVLSGKGETLQQIAEQLASKGIKTRQLTVSHAFHSPLMEPMLDEFRQVASTITYQPPQRTLISNVTGQRVYEEIATPDYWVTHVREAVRFADGVKVLHEQNVDFMIEIGSKPTLLGMVELQSPEGSSSAPTMMPSLRENRSDWQQMLESLSQLYAHGVEIDWIGFDKDYVRHKVALPTYPWQRQRYWLESAQPFGSLSTLQKQAAKSLGPLIDRRIKVPRHNETLFEKEFSLEALPFLDDYRIYGSVVSSGASHLSMILSIVEYYATGRVNDGHMNGRNSAKQTTYLLKDVTFPAPLVIPDEASHTVQVACSPSDAAPRLRGNETHFELFSFAEDVPESSSTDADSAIPVTHANGQFKLEDTVPPRVDLEELQARCSQEIECDAFYQTFADKGLVFGPHFRWLEKVWIGDGEALARLQKSESIESFNRYVIHPSLLDACTQVPIAISSGDKNGKSETAVPFALNELRCYQPANGQTWWIHATEKDQHIWDISLIDEHGQVVAELMGLENRVATPETMLGNGFWHNWLYTVDWQPQPLTIPDEPDADNTGAETWLLFAQPEGIGADLAAHLQSQGKHCVFVVPGRQYTVTEQHIAHAGHFDDATLDGVTTGAKVVTLNPASLSDYKYFLETLTDSGSPCQHVLYLWNRHDLTNVSDNLPDLSVPDIVLDLCSGLLHLVQALSSMGWAPNLWLITQNSQAVGGDLVNLQIEQAPLWALSRTIHAEHPEFDCHCLDFDTLSNGTQLLLNELQATERESQIAYRQGTRYVARLIRYQVEHQALTQAEIKPDGGYLITGGLGGLGLQVALALADAGARHLILNGRRGTVSQEAQSIIDQLRQEDVRIDVIAADISDAADSERLLVESQRKASLRGIVHAAGVLDDGILLQQDRARFEKVMAAKVRGAWHLDQLSQTLDLDFFIAFSSVASFIEEPGQANYAAANAFLDSLMHYRHARGSNSLSINWGAWAEVGMAANLSFEQPGITSIPPAQGGHVLVELIQRLNRDTSPQIAVQPTHWSEYLSRDGLNMPFYEYFAHHLRNEEEAKLRQTAGSSSEQVSLRQQLQRLSETDRDALLIEHLETTTVKVLGLASHQKIDPYQGLMGIGMDSLMAVEFRNHLARSLERPLPATLLFNYPTLGLLHEYLVANMFDAPTNHLGLDSAEQGSDSISSIFIEASIEEIDDMEVDDAAKMLSQLLDMEA